MILGDYFPPGGPGPQRGDRYRPGIVGVVLVRVTGLQQPHPRRQLRRHIQHPLTGGDQLLGQQPAQAAPPSTAQLRSGHATAHASSRSAWDGQARTRNSPSGSSAPPIATAVCEPLCGSIPIITSVISTLPTVVTEPKARGGHA